MREKQSNDPVIREVLLQFETGQSPAPSLRTELPELALLLRELNRLELKNGVLYRRRQDGPNTVFQLVLPTELRPLALESLHDEMGHMGVERTVDLARARFYWPKMHNAIEDKIRTCERCVRRKALPERAAPLVNIRTSRPLELVCMDFLSLEPDSSNTKDVLVITDHFTKYAVAVPTPNQRARTVAKTLWENFIVHYGFPERLHSDQGADFESNTIKELCQFTGVKKVRTTPYHPRGNPVERFNRTLLQMLGTLSAKNKMHWKDFVKPLVHAYNCTKNEVTGYSPYELMFGRQPRLPVDLVFGLPVSNIKKTHSQYVADLKCRLEESYKIAISNAGKNAQHNKTRFDKRVTESVLHVGDRVLVRNVKLRGKHKLADKWEEDIYIVLRAAGEAPVYTVKPERKDGPVRTLHRDLLLPCHFLPVMSTDEPELQPSVRNPRTRRHPVIEDDKECEDFDSDSDEIPDWIPVPSMTSIPDVSIPIKNNPKLSGLPCVVWTNDRVSPPFFPANPTPVEVAVEIPAEIIDTEPPVQDLPEDGTQPDYDDLPASNPPSDEDKSPENEPLPDCDSPENVNPFLDHKEKLRTAGGTPPVMMDVSGAEEETTEAQDTVIFHQPESTHEKTTAPPRRSQRHHEKPERLQYPRLGDPLLAVVNSLFQGLSNAFTTSLAGFENPDVN